MFLFLCQCFLTLLHKIGIRCTKVLMEQLCPKCNHYLTPLTVDTQGHGRITIDHCHYCGGVWFDHFQINRFSTKDALSLSKMATDSDLQNIQGSNQCPRDHALLVNLRSDSVPGELTVLTCPRCGGNFVTKNTLVELKKAQKIKLDYFKTWKIPLPKISSVLVPVMFIFAVTLGVFLTVKNIKQTNDARIRAKEIIGVPTIVVSENNTVLVSFTTNIPTLSTIAYTAAGEVEPHTVPVSLEKTKNHLIMLTNIEPKTTYTFKIYCEEIPDQILSSPNYTFTTN